MKRLGRIANSLTRSGASFGRDEGGSFATMMGVSVLAVTLCAGVAVDYARVAHTRAVVNDALDAAVLAAAAELSSGTATGDQLKRNFEDFFDANVEGRSVHSDDISIVRFDVDEESGKVSAAASADVRMAFMGLAGTSNVEVATAAEATYSSDSVEVAMVLDVTGSMGRNRKLDALKLAAKDAVDILLPADSIANKVRIGLVPYSWSVNAGEYARPASGGLAVRCVTERGGDAAASDASYTLEPVLALTSDCPSQEIRPLTNRRDNLIGDINSFRAEGYTAGHIGIAWGYYMLSENWQSLWNASARPADYADPVKKVAIIMTDGEFNTFYYGVPRNPYGTQEAKSSAAAVALCDDMKRKKAGQEGITIYSIAFDAPRSAEETLRSCASADSANSRHFFSASNPEELRQAFASIALDIQKLRLSK